MKHSIFILLSGILSLFALTAAHPNLAPPQDITIASTELGINCRGSAMCLSCPSISSLQDMVNQIEDGVTFSNGKQIACAELNPGEGGGALCAFPQRMGGKTVSARNVKNAVQWIIDHGCDNCGSVPLYVGNDVNMGEITVNYVRHGCGHGVCH